jgi:hypothetical protein
MGTGQRDSSPTKTRSTICLTSTSQISSIPSNWMANRQPRGLWLTSAVLRHGSPQSGKHRRATANGVDRYYRGIRAPIVCYKQNLLLSGALAT